MGINIINYPWMVPKRVPYTRKTNHPFKVTAKPTPSVIKLEFALNFVNGQQQQQ